MKRCLVLLFFPLVFASCYAVPATAPRTVEEVVGDKDVERDIMLKFHYNPRLTYLKVACRRGIVTVSGDVDPFDDRDEAVRLARSARGVRDIVSLINIRERQ